MKSVSQSSTTTAMKIDPDTASSSTTSHQYLCQPSASTSANPLTKTDKTSLSSSNKNNKVPKVSKEDDSEKKCVSPTTSNHPEEYLNGHWDVDRIQYCNFNPVTSRLNDSLSINTIDTKRMKNGAAYKAFNDKDPSEYKCFRDERNELYRVGDFVYMEIETSYPYFIGKIESFKMKKGTQMTVKTTLLYRREDLLPDSQSLLAAERREAGLIESNEEIRVRELFPSDAHLTQSVAVLKGKCQIIYLPIKNAFIDGYLENEVFFYCTSYSPDTGRLSACHQEIREGKKYQAECPDIADSVISDEPDRDQLVYKPGNMCADVEDLVVKFARSYRSLALLENPQINDLERAAFQGDRVTDDALDCLTRCGYVAKDAIKQMMDDDLVFLEHTQFLEADDAKKFVKGLRNFGKNFPKIIKEYMPAFSREALVNYYYLWKKSNDAFKPKKGNGTSTKKSVLSQLKRPQRINNTEPTLVDYESVSEDDDFEFGRACHHCYTLQSCNWHHSGYFNQLLCNTCRQHFKRYGTMRKVERPKDIPRSLLHEEALNGAEEGDEGVKTRASNRRDRLKTPIDDERAPTKNGDVDYERRSTPQRSVKAQKRTYNLSTSSAEELLTPKKYKDSKSNKLKPIHQLVLTNKLSKIEKQESVDSCDDQCNKNASTSNVVDDAEKVKPKQEEEPVDSEQDQPVEIQSEHRLQKHSDCMLVRLHGVEDAIDFACARTQITFKCDDEAKWTERRREQAELKQKQRREAAAKNQAEAEKQRFMEQEQQHIRQMQQFQQAAAAQQTLPMGHLSRAPQDLLHHQMRLSTLTNNSMIRPSAIPHLTPELMALASTRPELLQVFALQQQQAQQQQQQPRPPILMQPFGVPSTIPGLNPAALMHAQSSSNALMYQMQSQAAQQQQQQQQARLLEEQKRQHQQLEQREREQRQRLQHQMQNQQMLMAMGFNPQMLAAATGFQLGANLQGLTLPQASQPPQQQQSQQPVSQQINPTATQLDHLAQMLRGGANPAIALQQQQQQNQQDLMQLLTLRFQQEQQQQQRNQQQK